jgi:hypothetical protein
MTIRLHPDESVEESSSQRTVLKGHDFTSFGKHSAEAVGVFNPRLKAA